MPSLYTGDHDLAWLDEVADTSDDEFRSFVTQTPGMRMINAHEGVRSFEDVYTELTHARHLHESRFSDQRWLKRIREAAKIVRAVEAGKVRSSVLLEILTTSDFPLLFGDIIDRRLLNQYNSADTSWQQYVARGTVPDFRDSRLIAIDGLAQPFDLAPAFTQEEQQEVKYDNSIAETGYVTNVKVYAKAVAFSWKMMINRSLNFLSRFPQLLATGARRTEQSIITKLFVSSTGPNATFFSVGNANIVTGNPALSITGLKAALNTMYAQLDAQGQPIEIEGITLVVPPLLKITAQEVLKAVSLELVPPTSAAGVRVLTPNWASDITPVVNWYLPIVDVSANRHTTWYLFANPSINRPALEATFLEGYEQPTLWQKAPNTQRVGGAVDPMMGDFADMSQHYKSMHIVGGTRVDPKMAVASNGSGS